MTLPAAVTPTASGAKSRPLWRKTAWRSTAHTAAMATSTVAQIASSARDEDPDVIGLSILSGSHLELVPEVLEALRTEGVDAPVVVGGIIPDADQRKLLEAGVTRVYTPKDYELSAIMADVVELAAQRRA